MTNRPTPADMANWPPPNYDNPETRVGLLLGIELPCVCVMTLFMAGRFYARGKRKALGIDDWVMVLPWMLAVAISICNCVATRYGTGYHIWDFKPQWAAPTGKMALVTQALFPPCVGLTKISVCLTYLRIFPLQKNQRFCYTTIVLLALWTVPVFFVSLFQCIPIKAYWDTSITNAHCINPRAALIASATLNSLSDILVFLWPAQYLWNLQLPSKERNSLLVGFTLGCIICVAGACRIWLLEVYFSSYDVFYNGATLIAIAAIESNVGIICGSLPGVRLLLAGLFPQLFSSSESHSYPTHPSFVKRPSQCTGDETRFPNSAAALAAAELAVEDIELAERKDDAINATVYQGSAVVNGRNGDGESEEWIFAPQTGDTETQPHAL